MIAKTAYRNLLKVVGSKYALRVQLAFFFPQKLLSLLLDSQTY